MEEQNKNDLWDATQNLARKLLAVCEKRLEEEKQIINSIVKLLDTLNPDKDKYFEDEYTKRINISPIIEFLRALYYVDEDSKDEDGVCDPTCLSDLAVFEDEPFSDLLDRLENMEIIIYKGDLQ